MELAREIPLSDGDGRSRLEIPVSSSGEDETQNEPDSLLPSESFAYHHIEILQQGSDEFEAIGFSDRAPETLASGTLDELSDQFPQAEVITCAALGADSCTILALGGDRCPICES